MTRDESYTFDELCKDLLTPQAYFVTSGLMNIAKFIGDLRIRKGFSYAQLALLCGLSERRIRDIESLNKIPDLEEILSILYVLEHTISIVEL